MKNNKKSGKNGSFYIALCGCAVVVALVSYVSDLMKDEKPEEEENIAFLEEMDEEDFSGDIAEIPEFDRDLGEIEEEPEIVVIEPEIDLPQTEPVAAEEEVDEFLPVLPASGKVTAEFSGDSLVLYEHLGDWRTHAGIDIEANVGDDVYLCEDGVVEKIYRNNLGGCILVDHENGYKSLYACLGETNLVAEGDRLICGETIGRVGDTAVGDITKTPHVHFEMYHEGKAINPLDIAITE